MKKVVSIICAVALILALCLCCAGCSQADRVSTNLSEEADRFNVTRRLAVINCRSDKPVFELIGNFSIETDSVDHQLEVVVEYEKGLYKKHFIYLNEWITYTVEDVSGAYVDNYHYEFNYLPEMINPVTITQKD
jgi:hypothetical protein